ncbi:MAG: META domain-containing protein, partial [Actinomycetes bacterium]
VGGWKVTGLNNGVGGLESSAATQAFVLIFTEDQLTARGDCNLLTANYSTTGEEPLTFSPVSSTKKACEGEAAEADEWMTAALGRTTDYEVVGGTLTLRAADGAMQVTATRG